MGQKRVFKYIPLTFSGFQRGKTKEEEHNRPLKSFIQGGFPVVEKW